MQEYLFRGIPKGEWTNLFNFIQAKKLRIDNLREAEMGPGAALPSALDLGDDIDTGTLPPLCHMPHPLSAIHPQGNWAGQNGLAAFKLWGKQPCSA